MRLLRSLVAMGLLCCSTPMFGQSDDCATPTPAVLGANAYTTVGATTSPQPDSGCPTGVFWGAMSNDVWWTYTAAVTGTHQVNNCSTTHDSDLEIYEQQGVDPCDTSVSVGCSGDSCGLRSSVTWVANAGTTYVIRLGSWAAAGTGAGDLTLIEAGVEDCFDGIDNDLDGLVDCADTVDCPTGVAPCIEDCFDGIDNDGDGLVDCADAADCPAGVPPCVENCADGIDNDGDGLVDCNDADCAAEAACIAGGNDYCSGALPINCGDVVMGDTTPATVDPWPTCGTTSGTAGGLWYSFAGNGDQVTLSTCGGSGYDTKIRVWSGSCAAPVCVTGNDDACGLQSTVAFLSTLGETYLVLVHGFGGGFGAFNMTVTCLTPGIEDCLDGLDNDLDGLVDCADPDCALEPTCQPPPHDDCLMPELMVLGGNPYDNALATDSLQADSGCPTGSFWGAMSKDLWWTYTAAISGGHRVDNCASGHDSDLEVYELVGADPCDTSLSVGCSGDSCGLNSAVNWAATAGTTYVIRLGSWGAGASGSGSLVLSELLPEDCTDGIDNDMDGLIDCADALDCPFGVPPCIPPANDDCTMAAMLAVGPNAYDLTLASDSLQADSGCPAGSFWGAMSKDVWWTYTATSSTAHRVDNCALGHDSDLEVYELQGGDPCDTSLSVGCSGDSCGLNSSVTWSATSGTTYVVRLGSWGAGASGTGDLVLTVGGAEDCFDGLDNDFDGLVDCQDPDCALEPSCQENCLDGVDNDGDGFVDCADSECACDAACPVPTPGNECCDPLPVVAGANPFDTTGFTTSSDIVSPGQCAGTFFGASSNDGWYLFTASITGTVFYDTCQSFDTDVTIYEGSNCATKVQIACNGDGVGLVGCTPLYSAGQFPVTMGTQYLIRIGGWGVATQGTGVLNISETCSAAVSNLVGSADCTSGDVTLTWNPAGFDSYDIERDGLQIATGLAAGTVTYTDIGVANGSYDYGVVGVCTGGGGATSNVAVTMAAYNGEQDLVVRGELAAGLVDSVAALTAELTALGRTFVVHDGGFGDYPCNTAPFAIVWNMNGSFPNWRRYTVTDGAALRAAQLAGTSVYTESGDQWGFTPVATDFDLIDGVASGVDGNDTFLGMDGLDSTFGLDLSDLVNVAYTQDSAGNDWTDQLTVSTTDAEGPNAAAIWQLDDALGVPYVTGVFYDTAAGGKTISQTWEFGGFGGDKNDLASRYVAALGGGGPPAVTFVRGRCNGDAAVNIADAVYLLGFLFPGVNPPNVINCRDACDANDDGALNIADVIRLLGSLFGAVTVPLPLPNAMSGCGPDPTDMDPLECVTPAACP